MTVHLADIPNAGKGSIPSLPANQGAELTLFRPDVILKQLGKCLEQRCALDDVMGAKEEDYFGDNAE